MAYVLYGSGIQGVVGCVDDQGNFVSINAEGAAGDWCRNFAKGWNRNPNRPLGNNFGGFNRGNTFRTSPFDRGGLMARGNYRKMILQPSPRMRNMRIVQPIVQPMQKKSCGCKGCGC